MGDTVILKPLETSIPMFLHVLGSHTSETECEMLLRFDVFTALALIVHIHPKTSNRTCFGCTPRKKLEGIMVPQEDSRDFR